ncbi:MAG: UPF0147 family protein [Nitrososphaerales archaeon]|nr:UPF0147 family protein [Nitrososphaerales archaeon]|tara:strand:+ start:1855 stop:2136 length:282 start_codon:yes stop_codon:yes gene_type:complete
MSETKQKENEEKIVKSIAVLQSIADSNITPRNIRKIVKDSMIMLQDKTLSQGVRAANAISMLDEISQDPNMPSYARVTIWNAVSTLESVREVV